MRADRYARYRAEAPARPAPGYAARANRASRAAGASRGAAAAKPLATTQAYPLADPFEARTRTARPRAAGKTRSIDAPRAARPRPRAEDARAAARARRAPAQARGCRHPGARAACPG